MMKLKGGIMVNSVMLVGRLAQDRAPPPCMGRPGINLPPSHARADDSLERGLRRDGAGRCKRPGQAFRDTPRPRKP